MKSKSWVKTPSHKILRDPGSKLHVPIIAAIIIFCNSLVASAQEYEVVSFDFALKDLTARSANTSRIDGNGKKCAVLKIYANDNITEAEGNVIGDIIDKGMEKWIYMSRDSKEVKLLFEHHYPLHINFIDYDYPMVSEQMVYIVKLREKPMENENALSTNTQNPNSNPNFPTSDSSRSKDQSPIENQSDLHQKTVIIYSPEKPDSIDGFDNAIEGVIANQMQTKEGYSNDIFEIVPYDGALWNLGSLFSQYPLIDYQIKKGDKWDLTPDIVNSLIQTSVKSGPYPYESSIDSNPNNIGRALSFGQKPDIRLVTMYFKQGHLSFIQYSIDYSFNQKEAEEEKKTFNAMLKIYLDDKGFSKIGEKEVLKLVHRILKDTKYYVNHKKRELIEVSDKRNYIILEKY